MKHLRVCLPSPSPAVKRATLRSRLPAGGWPAFSRGLSCPPHFDSCCTIFFFFLEDFPEKCTESNNNNNNIKRKSCVRRPRCCFYAPTLMTSCGAAGRETPIAFPFSFFFIILIHTWWAKWNQKQRQSLFVTHSLLILGLVQPPGLLFWNMMWCIWCPPWSNQPNNIPTPGDV